MRSFSCANLQTFSPGRASNRGQIDWFPRALLGISNGVLEQFQLSLDAGIASYLFPAAGRVFAASPEAERDPQIRSEFDLLGTRVAIPVLDRESLVGVALFDGRVTGEPMINEELALIFHLLEQLGLAIKNIWWHDQVSARHQMMFDILGQIKSGCVVIGRGLNVLHANRNHPANIFQRAGPERGWGLSSLICRR